MKLSDRINDTNAAPWVIEEIKRLESERDALKREVSNRKGACRVLEQGYKMISEERDALASRVDFLNQQNSAQQEHNDALSAHVELLTRVTEKLSTVAPEYLDHLAADSLARLKAGWLKGIKQQSRRVRNYSAPDQVFEAIPINAIDCELLRQAEEAE